MSLLEVLTRGGWIMIPVVLSSIVVIALGISRFLTLRRERDELGAFVRKWMSASASTDKSRFFNDCQKGPRVLAEMSGLFDSKSVYNTDAAQELETVARNELYRMETGLGTIGTLAAVTPLMGFLGTVTGMIRAFMQIQNLGGNVNANVLAGGIWEALVTTAAGLTVGILALIIHNYLATIVRNLALMLEKCGAITLRILADWHES